MPTNLPTCSTKRGRDARPCILCGTALDRAALGAYLRVSRASLAVRHDRRRSSRTGRLTAHITQGT